MKDDINIETINDEGFIKLLNAIAQADVRKEAIEAERNWQKLQAYRKRVGRTLEAKAKPHGKAKLRLVVNNGRTRRIDYASHSY